MGWAEQIQSLGKRMCCGRLSSAISNSAEKNGNLFDALRMKLKACLTSVPVHHPQSLFQGPGQELKTRKVVEPGVSTSGREGPRATHAMGASSCPPVKNRACNAKTRGISMDYFQARTHAHMVWWPGLPYPSPCRVSPGQNPGPAETNHKASRHGPPRVY